MRDFFARLAHRAALLIGHPAAFSIAVACVAAWALSGGLFGYSETWQLIINTGTTIVTFLMIFLIQNTQNRDGKVVQLKLDELLRAMRGARNELIDLEDLTEEEIERYHREFGELQARYARELEKRRAGPGGKPDASRA